MGKQYIKSTNNEIEDQIKEIEKDYNYRLVEWPIEVLVKKFVSKAEGLTYSELLSNTSNSLIVVPKYQRDYEWSSEMRSKFIESLFMKVPMPPLFVFLLDGDGNMELIDGVQRLSTIKEFVDDKHILFDLEVLSSLNGYKFSEFEIARQRKFNNLSLKIYILDEESDESIRADIFNRINSTGKKLSPAQIRKGAFLNNKFYDFILECTEFNEFNDLFSAHRNDDKLRGEKEELVTRFFAYSESYLQFEHSVKLFLDDYIKSKKDISFDEKELKLNEFKNSLDFVKKYFPFGFRKTENAKSIPRVRFESIAIGVNLALKENPNLANPNLKWLDSNEFKYHTTSDAANNKNKLIGRIEFVQKCLLGKININNDLSYDN